MTSSRRFRHLDVAGGAVGLALVLASLLGVSTAGASTGPADGSDWGASGLLTSDTQVTSRWDNVGNAATSTVARNQNQVIPHTGGKDYFQIPNNILDAYDSHFGPDNGLGGLKVAVSQTGDLVNQAVTVDISGAVPDIPAGAADSLTYFQVFQCWGAMGADGKPDLQATSPDPATCQVGATGSDSIGGSAKREYRVLGGDPLVQGGDWAQYDSNSLVEVPFTSITGVQSGPNLSLENTFFNRTTTNEFSHVTVPVSGTTQRQFEVQTGAESQGLGCGARTDEASTPVCWLVVVPRIQGVMERLGPTAPSVWAQRMQFQLNMQDVVTSCAKGSARTILAGSEMLATAAASWTPGVCDSAQVALGYTRLGDETARNQFRTGAADAVLTSDPVPPPAKAIHVPLTLTAPVIALNVDYQPVCLDEDVDLTTITNDDGAAACGFTDLADVKANLARSGQPIRTLRLNAPLVAKLLTQSYQNSMINCSSDCVFAVNQGTMPQWSVERPTALTNDPDFRALNPQLHMKNSTGLSEFILEAARSDAASTVWRWLLADPEAASFLSGCPDDNDVVINPFYSSRTYTGCSQEAAALETAAATARAATTTPSGFVDVPLVYPPDGSPFPLPNWQEQAATDDRPALTLVDHLPRVDNMQVGGRDTFIGYKPRNSDFCSTVIDSTCQPPPGKWRDLKIPQPFGRREILAITDAPTAARYELPTAALCDDAGTHCVEANTASLQSAADKFVNSTITGVRAPGPVDYAGGAYPLTLPVYAAVQTDLDQARRAAYADAFDYVLHEGQTAGYQAGELPPGYAPLTSNLRGDAASAITLLRVADPVVKPSKDPSAEPSESSEPSATATPTATSPPSLPGAAAPSGPAVPTAAPATPAATAPAAPPQTVAVAASTETWPGYLLPLGLSLALFSGLAGQFLRRRTNVKLG